MNVAYFKKAIKAMNISQEEFADRVGISYAALKTYFNGKRIPPVDVFEKMCNVAGCPLDWGLSGNHAPSFLFHPEYSEVYGLLKHMGFDVSCNPDNEDEILIESMGFSVKTNIGDLTDRIKYLLKFELYRLANDN